MRLAFLADVHGNHRALTACLDALPKYSPDAVCILGDFVTDCPYPERTLALLRACARAYPTRFIRGNREEYMIAHRRDPESERWTRETRSGSLLYTFERLTDADIDWFSEMPTGETLAYPGCAPLLICHGAPDDTRVQMKPCTDEARTVMRGLSCPYVVCGHTHQRYAYQYAGVWLYNGGSVGMPCNHQTQAQFMILQSDGNEWLPEYADIVYDIPAAVRDFAESGMTDVTGAWTRAVAVQLATGENVVKKLLIKARAVSDEARPGVPFLEIPESCFQRAAELIGI